MFAVLPADTLRAPRVCSMAQAAKCSVPVTVLTLLIGASLWPLFRGPTPERLLALTLQGLAALTLPHLLLERVAAAHPRYVSPCRSSSSCAANAPLSRYSG